jgi:hypothetical protein
MSFASKLSEPAADAGTPAVTDPVAGRTPPVLDLLALQRAVGNRAVGRLVAAQRLSVPRRAAVQRKLGDGHDLNSPRFSKIDELEAAYDGEKSVKQNDKGLGVQAIQQALYDIGFPLKKFGADGDYGAETVQAVKAFQRANKPLVDDGKVGPKTMAALDARFKVFKLPDAKERAAKWSPTCVCSILCPWSPHTVDVLHTRITLKSFDKITFEDEEWDGKAWVAKPFPGGGFNDGKEIGVLNTTCEKMAQTLYHEVLHAEQPTTHKTTADREAYAYRIGEEFSIAAGLSGRPGLRETGAHGREFASDTKVRAFVADKYPVPSGGAKETILGKGATLGEVQVQRPDGTIYTRPAAVGERVPGPLKTTGETTHAKSVWTCP